MTRKKVGGSKRFHVILRDDQVQKLRALQVRTGVPQAEQVRRAVDLYLKALERRQQKNN